MKGCKMGTQLKNDNNVIPLNRDISEQNYRNAEESIQAAAQVKATFAEEIIEVTVDQVAAVFGSAGIYPESSMIRPEQWVFLEDAIRSLAYRFYGISHPLQQFAEDNYEISEEDAGIGEKTPGHTGEVEAAEA